MENTEIPGHIAVFLQNILKEIQVLTIRTDKCSRKSILVGPGIGILEKGCADKNLIPPPFLHVQVVTGNIIDRLVIFHITADIHIPVLKHYCQCYAYYQKQYNVEP